MSLGDDTEKHERFAILLNIVLAEYSVGTLILLY